MSTKPLIQPGRYASLLWEAAGGTDSPIREFTRAHLGHPAQPGADIYLSPDLREYPGQVWLHEIAGAYPEADTPDTDRSDSAPNVFTGYLPAEAIASGRRVFGTTVRITWRNGRYEVDGVDGPAAEAYLVGRPEISYVVVQRNQLVWDLMRPTEPASGRVYLHANPGRDDGTWHYPPDQVTQDLIAMYGSGLTPGQGRAIQIEMNVTTGDIYYTPGAPFTDNSRDAASGAVDHAQVFVHYPRTATTSTHYGWVKLYFGQVAITQQDILIAPDSGGSGGGITEADLPNVAFNNKFTAKVASGAISARPGFPAGIGDAYYATDIQQLYIANNTGSSWIQYDLGAIAAGDYDFLLRGGGNSMTGELQMETNAIHFTERGVRPSLPGYGEWKLYFKPDGLYTVDYVGTETGPLGAGGGGSGSLSDYARISGGSRTIATPSSNVIYQIQDFSADYDSLGAFDELGNDDVLTIPGGKGGIYMIGFEITVLQYVTAMALTVLLRRNGGTISRATSEYDAAINSNYTSHSISGSTQIALDDYDVISLWLDGYASWTSNNLQIQGGVIWLTRLGDMPE